jgi:phage baseplate assembly protein gpV
LGGDIRIGTVSSVELETGMVSVIYRDRDDEVTQFLPYATFNDEYKPPKIGEKVVVLHLSNGGEMGIVLGTYWNEENKSKAQGIYHKKIAENAYFNYDKGILTILAEHIRFFATADGEDVTLAKLMEDIKKIKQKLDIT